MRWDDPNGIVEQIRPSELGELRLDVSVAFGRVLHRLRTERGMSQEALAAEAGLQRKYISLLERATYQPKIGTVFRLAVALECKPSELMALIEDELDRS